MEFGSVTLKINNQHTPRVQGSGFIYFNRRGMASLRLQIQNVLF